MRVRTDDALEVWAERRGLGPRLLVLSGTTADLRRTPTPFDTPLAEGFNLLTFDQRGLGRSDKPAGPYAIADYARDALGVMQAYRWSRAHVVGISFGGMVAQELAVRFPRAVRRLVLCCTASGGPGGSSYPLAPLLGLDAVERARHMAGIYDIRRDATWAAAHPAAYEALIAAAASDPFAQEHGASAARAAQLAARDAHDAWAGLAGVEAEVLVCTGRYDGVAPPDVQRALAKQLSATLRFYEGGHFFLQQDPKAYADIAAFLRNGREGVA